MRDEMAPREQIANIAGGAAPNDPSDPSDEATVRMAPGAIRPHSSQQPPPPTQSTQSTQPTQPTSSFPPTSSSGAPDDATLLSRPGPATGAPPTPALGLPVNAPPPGFAPTTDPTVVTIAETAAAIPVPTADPGGALNTYIGAPANAVEVAGAARVAQRSVQRDADFIRDKAREVAVTMHNLAHDLEPLNEISSRWDDADPRKLLVQRSFSAATRADNLLSLMMQALARLSMSAQTADTTINALQSERERLASLYQIAQELNSALDLEQLLGRVMTQLIDVIHAERGLLLLWDDHTGQLQFMAARGAEGQPLTEGNIGHSSNIVQRVWETQAPLMTTDAKVDPRLSDAASVRVNEIRSVMCAPLRVRGHGVGVVYVDSRRTARLFSNASLDLLAAFCNQAAIAIDNARLFADLRTRIREVSEIKTYMDNIFASIASGVVTADTQGTITTFNRAAEGIFGVGGGQVIGLPYQRALANLTGDAPTLADILDIMRSAIVRRQVTLGKEFRSQIPGRGEATLRLNVSPLQEVAAEGQLGQPLGVAMVVDDLTELRRSERQAREIRGLFGRYVHPEVVSYLLDNPSALHLGGETRQISVIFADIRNYTGLAVRYEPAEVLRILNEYLGVLTEAVWQQKGTLTMFIGDALMAIFNAPLPQPDHAQRAVRTAWAMRQALEHYHATQSQSLHAISVGVASMAGQAGQPMQLSGEALAVEYGIGVHTGLAVVGNIGARDRLQNYTAIGDAVNIAQRLQANARANQILLSADTFAQAQAVSVAHALDPIAVKGKDQPIAVYQLDGLRS